MSRKARTYLLILAGLLALAVFVGYQFLREFQKLRVINTVDKPKAAATLDAIEADSAAKQQELDQSDTEEWIRRKAHELGYVFPGEIKIVDKEN